MLKGAFGSPQVDAGDPHQGGAIWRHAYFQQSTAVVLVAAILQLQAALAGREALPAFWVELQPAWFRFVLGLEGILPAPADFTQARAELVGRQGTALGADGPVTLEVRNLFQNTQ